MTGDGHAIIRAWLWVLLATLLFAIMFTIPKFLDGSVAAVQVAFFRYCAGFLTIVPVFLMRRKSIRRERHPITGYGFHILRALMGSLSVVAIAYAVVEIPLANAQAINMTSGMFAAIFAVLVLRERLNRFGTAAIFISLAGAVVVAEPRLDAGGQWLSFGALAALASAVAWGIDSITLKYTSTRDDPARQLCIVNGAACLLLLGPALYMWRDAPLADCLLLLAMGPIAIFGQYCNIRGFRLANAVDLTIIRYSGIVFAVLIGIAIFDEWPNLATILGSAMIFASAFIMLRFGARHP